MQKRLYLFYDEQEMIKHLLFWNDVAQVLEIDCMSCVTLGYMYNGLFLYHTVVALHIVTSTSDRNVTSRVR